MTSTGAERMFAIGRAHDKRAGACRDDTKAGVVLGGMDNTVGFMRERENAEAEWATLRKRANAELKVTEAQKRLKVGMEALKARDEKLKGARAKKAAKKAERARLDALPLATRYSELTEMDRPALSDQLRKHKLLGKKGFTVTQGNRTAYVLQLQTLLLEADAGANDLPEGESGIDGRNVKRKVGSGGGGKAKGKKRKKPGVTEWMGYEWTEEEAEGFEVEAIVGKLVADGTSTYANQGKAKKGAVLYRVVWHNYPPDMVWYEPAENLGDGLLDEYETRAASEAAEDAREAQEEAELAEMEAEEAEKAACDA